MSKYTEALEFFIENGIQLTSEQVESLQERMCEYDNMDILEESETKQVLSVMKRKIDELENKGNLTAGEKRQLDRYKSQYNDLKGSFAEEQFGRKQEKEFSNASQSLRSLSKNGRQTAIDADRDTHLNNAKKLLRDEDSSKKLLYLKRKLYNKNDIEKQKLVNKDIKEKGYHDITSSDPIKYTKPLSKDFEELEDLPDKGYYRFTRTR